MKFPKTLGIFTVKKVLFYDNAYFTYGGFGAYLSEIRKFFKKTILVAHVSQQKPGEGYYEIATDNLEIVHLKQSRNEFENLLQQPANFFIANRVIRDMDIVHCRMPDYTGIIGVILSRIYKKQFFIQVIADWHIEAQKTPVFKKFGLGFFLKIDYYFYDFLERMCARNRLVFAQGTSSYLKHVNHSHAKLISSSAHFKKDIGTIKNKFVSDLTVDALHVGRLTGVKNQELIIDLIYELNKKTECVWNLKILGEGPLRQNLQNRIDVLGLGNRITLVGQVSRGKDFWKYFENADIFLMSSKSEGTPKVLLEAMARSVPVVAPNVGGIPFLVPHKERGLLYEEGNLDDFFKAVLLIKKDKLNRRKMIKNAFEFSKNNTVEKSIDFMVEEVAKFFKWQEK